MFDRQFRESLRQLDIRCAQRARWLGVREKEKEERDAEEIRRRAQEASVNTVSLFLRLPVPVKMVVMN